MPPFAPPFAPPLAPSLAPSVGAWALAPWLALAAFLLPVAGGLLGTLLPAFGFLPAIGGDALSLAPWQALAAQPGIGTSVRLSLQTGLLSAGLSLAVATAFCAAAGEAAASSAAFARLCHRLTALVPPMLAAPHVAVALGLAFLIAPSGWLVRLISPALTGWGRPPTDLVTVRDPQGLALVLGLMVKEVPYLVLMTLGALQQVPHGALRRAGAALGYRPAAAWFKLVFPPVYRQLRLPVYAVLAFSMSNVELGLILAPGNPPPLALVAARWFADYDLQRYFPAAAAALLQGLLVLAALGLWRVGEAAVATLGRRWCAAGGRAGPIVPLAGAAAALGVAGLALGAAALAGLAVWSVAQSWRFPQLWPAELTGATWAQQGPRVAGPALTTLGLALASAAVAVALAVACLECETRRGIRGLDGLHGGHGASRLPGVPGATGAASAARRSLAWVYVPLLVPQIAFLYGFQVLLVRLGWDGTWWAVAWAHLVFVLPYAFLSLADPWRALDPRYARAAAALGAAPGRVLWRLRLPLLTRPLGLAFAVGCGVSVGQYLPTLFAGAGRIATLTTEAVTLSSGGNARVIGVYAFLQAAVPLAVYAAAWAWPAWRFRHRQGLRLA